MIVKLENGEIIDSIYECRPPLVKVKDGFGYLGVLQQNEEGRIQCHVCGKWYKFLTSHTWQTHGIYHDEYCITYGFGYGTPFCSVSMSQDRHKHAVVNKLGDKLIEHIKKHGPCKDDIRFVRLRVYTGSHQFLVKHGTGDQHIVDRFNKFVASLGRLPTWVDFEKDGYVLYNTITRKCGGYNEFLLKHGYIVPKRTGSFSDSDLIGLLRSFYVKYGRYPSSKECLKTKGLPHRTTFIIRFGSYDNAIELAMHGTIGKNSIGRKVKITEDDIKLMASGIVPMRELMKKYDRSYTMIYRYIRNYNRGIIGAPRSALIKEGGSNVSDMQAT